MTPKAIFAVLAAVATILVGALSDNSVSAVEWVNMSVAFVTAVSMFVVPNLNAGVGKYAKGIVTFLLAAFAVVYTVLSGGITVAEWLQVAIAGATAIGVPLLAAPQHQPVSDKV